ncbi:protein PLANT CADMIUM RESISTANCE 8-like [Pistacia vera]|uniref:protein PLANT CADMIUM RESISTANCE 8-like n=1 Tax=Pistacia vera TaxID=55513 RepID=UPI001263BB82|nr:protein PLANT CADMIUM RESISTANCE 8-like [Pistacia vera]
MNLSYGEPSFMYTTMPILCSQWIIGSNYREKLRRKYNLVEASYSDLISHTFCLWCSLCQEFRELKNRNIDLALGWYEEYLLNEEEIHK